MTLRTPAFLLLSLVAIACDAPGSGGKGRVQVTATTTGAADTTHPTSVSDASTTSPADTTTSQPDTVTTSCAAFPLQGSVPGFTNGGDGTWTSPQVNLVGGAAPDVAALSFDSNQTGSFSLVGEQPNTCTRCVSFFVDIGQGGQAYFATEGTMDISAPPLSQLDVTLRNVRLSAVDSEGTVDFSGPCYTVNTLSLSGGDTCEGSCSGRSCGSDGCGGSCGTCSGTQTCSASGQCQGGSTGSCTTITTPTTLEAQNANAYLIDLTSLNLGGSGSDYLQAEFYSDATGNFQLGSTTNKSYASCEQCLRIFEDDGNLQLFQTAGSINVSGTPQDGVVSITLSGVELREADIVDGTFETTIVSGGKCYKLANRTLATP